MSKKFLSIFIMLTLLFSTSSSALADDSSAQQNINESLVKYKQLDNKILSLNSEISDLNGQVLKLKEKLKSSETSINKIKLEIKDTQDKLVQSKSDIEKEQSLLDNRVRAMYKRGGSSDYIELLVSSGTVTSFLSRVAAISKVISLDNNLIAKLDNEKQLLNSTAQQLAIKQDTMLQLTITTENDLKDLQEKQESQKQLIVELNDEKLQLASTIQANEEALVAHPTSIINSQDVTITQIKDALTNLQQLLPQLNTQSVKQKVEDTITTGTTKLSTMNKINSDSSQTEKIDYKATLSMTATAYFGGTVTALGLKPIRSESGISTIAVDPSVIPLGSKVYIPNYGYAIASDTGLDIKGNIIDLYMNSQSECSSWGRRDVTVHIIAYPGEW